jgi:hypothetical protein
MILELDFLGDLMDTLIKDKIEMRYLEVLHAYRLHDFVDD